MNSSDIGRRLGCLRRPSASKLRKKSSPMPDDMIKRDDIPNLVTIHDLHPGVKIRLHQADATPVDFVVVGQPEEHEEYITGDWPLKKQSVPRVQLRRLFGGAVEYAKLSYFGIIPLPDGTWDPTNYCTKLPDGL